MVEQTGAKENERPLWIFDLQVYGSFVISTRFQLEEAEAFFADEVVFREIEIRPASYGAQVFFKMYADNGLVGSHLALFYLDRLLDVLAARCNSPFIASRQEARPFLRDRGVTKRALEKTEWQSAFRETHYLFHQEPHFMDALGAYRQGLCLESPTERFLAFHQVLCRRPTRHTGALWSNIREHTTALEQVFVEMWGDAGAWPHFLREEGALEEVAALALQCRHGTVPLMPSTLTRVFERLELLHRAAYALLLSWRKQIELPGEFYAMSLYPETGWGHLLH
ncbi:MAG: hypothetical protein H6727_14600 [Myxococcales bacterium]|nr:hypothetical protein [Myxococcales bacterium]